MARQEKDFNSELVKSFLMVNAYAYKIPDMPKTFGTRFIPEKPCDIFGATPDAKFFIEESKFFKKKDALTLNHFQASQIFALTKVSKMFGAGHAYVALNYFCDGANIAIFLDWKKIEKFLAKGKISYEKLHKLAVCVIVAQKCKKGKIWWDVSELFK